MVNLTPSLAVIISCFNYERFIGRAIESVVVQAVDRCELLIVDDGSTDSSWEIIQSYRLPGCYRIANGGAARACFHAFQQSQAPFVLFLDADDELAPGSLAEVIRHLDPGVAKLQFALTPVDAAGVVLGPPAPRLEDYRERQTLMREVARTGFYTSPPTSGNVFCRALCELLAEVDYEMSVDGVTLFAAPFFGDVVSLSKPLGFYRLHSSNYSQAGSQPTAQRFRIEADRFLARHAHLGRLLRARKLDNRLIDGHRVFYYRERRLYQKILEDGRPTAADILPMQIQSLKSTAPLGRRCTMMLFLALCLLLPRRARRALLAYRFRTGRRSLVGLIRHFVTQAGQTSLFGSR